MQETDRSRGPGRSSDRVTDTGLCVITAWRGGSLGLCAGGLESCLFVGGCELGKESLGEPTCLCSGCWVGRHQPSDSVSMTECPTIQFSSDTGHQQLVSALQGKSGAPPAALSSATSHKPGGCPRSPPTSSELGHFHNSLRLRNSLEQLAELADGVAQGWGRTCEWRNSPRELTPNRIHSSVRRGGSRGHLMNG